MTAIVDEAGIDSATWAYGADGRAVSSERADGTQFHRFQYNSDGSAQITDPIGITRTQSYSWVGSKALFTGQSQPCSFCIGDASNKMIDAATGMVTQSTDYMGVATLFTNDSQRKLPLSVTRAVGRPEAQTVQTEWHPTFRLPVRVIEASRITSSSYDALGNILNQTIVDTATNQIRTSTGTRTVSFCT